MVPVDGMPCQMRWMKTGPLGYGASPMEILGEERLESRKTGRSLVGCLEGQA